MERYAVRQGRYPTKSIARQRSFSESITDVLVVLIIVSVLAGVGVPRYLKLRPVIKARDCKERIEALARSNAAFALRDGQLEYAPKSAYTGTAAAFGGLLARLEGLPARPTCPLDGTAYDILGDSAGSVVIRCPNARAHAAVLPVLKDYVRRGLPVQPEGIP